jgi:hypothetical protein
MSNRIENRIVLGSLRYKSAPDTTLMIKVPFVQSSKNIVEYDRTSDIALEQVFDDERQKSTFFRPSAKYTFIFKNSYSGTTTYTPFENNLYYTNEEQAAASQCLGNSIPWEGLPQYNEFDFIRNDYNVQGYTQPPNEHILFTPKSASTYNWGYYMSYPYQNDYTKKLQAIIRVSGLPANTSFNWIVSDGIPFVILNKTFLGRNIVSLWSPIKHGMSVGEYVKLNFSYNDGQNLIDTFQVYSLGDETVFSDGYVVNIINPGFIGNTFNDGVQGTYKRVINLLNQNETTSEYYVRQHKILTSINDAVLVKSGFEENIFNNNRKYEIAVLTPNNIARVSTKEGSKSYTLSFNRDIDLTNLVDNQKRPVTELFYTTVWKGYFGWTFGLSNGQGGFYGLKQGYEFNLPYIPSTTNTTPWWVNNNANSDTNFPINSYNTVVGGLGKTFTYIENLNVGDIMDGDICEWNFYELKERPISTLYHKIKFNPIVFQIGPNSQNPYGYYYQPHFGVNVREYSDYIEDGNPAEIEGIPNYAYYSVNRSLFTWRDIYSYGFIDSNGIGVNFPFMNGKHHPYRDIIFRLIPEGTNLREFNQIQQLPTIDGCE